MKPQSVLDAVDRCSAVHEYDGDPEQEYLADGVVEEILSALSRVRASFVGSQRSRTKVKPVIHGK
jgi:TolB-like protein